jgi:hypothetical protein
MRRMQLFELTDLSFWPDAFRRLLTDYVSTSLEILQPFGPKLPLLVQAIEASGSIRVVDLCSGSAGPWRSLVGQLRLADGRAPLVTLTDRFPTADIAREVAAIPGVTYYPQPVDARSVPMDLAGVRTLFDGFHHFPPAQARAILQDAVDQGRAIAVFELLRRSWPDVLMSLLTPLYVLGLTPFIRPFRWSRLLFTYVIPVAPIAILWDASVSVLRCYSVGELRALVQTLEGAPYRWELGTYRHRGAGVTYLVGFPHAAVARNRQ